MVLVGANVAKADGFVCETLRGDLNVKVFNHTNPNKGTRNAAVMVLSDPSIQFGNKTIASFSDVKSTLGNSGATYVADVDLRVSESNRGGELISGTKLMYLDQIVLDIDFAYNQPVEAGEEIDAKMTLIKRDGQHIVRHLTCSRYLKN